jgi:hypothetical protein
MGAKKEWENENRALIAILGVRIQGAFLDRTIRL